jgi:hypothetical protein
MSLFGVNFEGATHEVLAEAVNEWHRTYHRADTLSDAIALHLEEATVNARLKPGGRLNVAAEVKGVAPHEITTSFGSFLRIRPGKFARQ